MQIYSIYKITNKTNGKTYIGFDSNWPNRKYQHKSRSKKNKKYHLYLAINKYGWNNFEWDVIYQSTDASHTLKIMEPYFIKEFNSFTDGYNMTEGGEGTTNHIRDPQLAKDHSERMKRYFSDPKNKLKKGEDCSKLWTVTDPNGIKYDIKNLAKFCREHNLDSGNMSAVSKGRYKQYRGWTVTQR